MFTCLRILYLIAIAVLVYWAGWKPLMADLALTRYLQGDKDGLNRALDWQPDSSLLIIRTGDYKRAIDTHNGDLAIYTVHTMMGAAKILKGDKSGVSDIDRALYYYPDYKPAVELRAKIKANGKT